MIISNSLSKVLYKVLNKSIDSNSIQKQKALVLGYVENITHDSAVRDWFLANSGNGWQCDIVFISERVPSGHIVAYVGSHTLAVQYAIDNGYEILMMPYAGMYS